jgi:hypothetical protein
MPAQTPSQQADPRMAQVQQMMAFMAQNSAQMSQMPNGPQQMQAMMNQINMLMQQISMGPPKEEKKQEPVMQPMAPSKSDLAFGALFNAEKTKAHTSPGTSFDSGHAAHHSFTSDHSQPAPSSIPTMQHQAPPMNGMPAQQPAPASNPFAAGGFGNSGT